MAQHNYDELHEMFDEAYDPVLGSKWVCKKCGITAKSTEFFCPARQTWGVTRVRCHIG